MTRLKACIASGFAVWTVGLGTVLSFNHWAEIKWFFGMTFFDFLDFLTANIMLPLGGLAIAIFIGWLAPKTMSQNELSMGEGRSYRLWYFLVRYVTPVAVVIVFLNAIGVVG
jgi:NSS family neurotransmitter:Na+ symporter